MSYIKKVGLVVLFTSMFVSDIFAGTLTSFTAGDVLICFRKSGVANDMVVDMGSVAQLTNATVNQRIPITAYSISQLTAAVTNFNSVIWSAFAYYDQSVSPSSVQGTLFMSNPRTAIDTQTSFYPQASKNTQLNTIIVPFLSTIVPGAVDNYSTVLYNAASSTTAVIEPDNNNNSNYKNGPSYSFAIGPNFNFNDSFGGMPENTVPSNFTNSTTVARSDFYMIPPSNFGAAEVYLGYFELNTNGAMTYVAYPTSAPATPVITAITRVGSLSSVSFTTGSAGTYTLRGTNSAGLYAPRTNWPAITSVAGNGSVNILQDTTSTTNKFYVITAQ